MPDDPGDLFAVVLDPFPETLDPADPFTDMLDAIDPFPDELDPVLKVKLLELIAAVLVVLEDKGGDVAERDDAIIQVWIV